jgi:hypothetical protein
VKLLDFFGAFAFGNPGGLRPVVLGEELLVVENGVLKIGYDFFVSRGYNTILDINYFSSNFTHVLSV